MISNFVHCHCEVCNNIYFQEVAGKRKTHGPSVINENSQILCRKFTTYVRKYCRENKSWVIYGRNSNGNTGPWSSIDCMSSNFSNYCNFGNIDVMTIFN